jgi:hypothetical protein
MHRDETTGQSAPVTPGELQPRSGLLDPRLKFLVDQCLSPSWRTDSSKITASESAASHRNLIGGIVCYCSTDACVVSVGLSASSMACRVRSSSSRIR